MANQSGNSGIGFIGLLQIAFIVLKLIGKIDWAWWWVLAPIWGTFALIIVVVLLVKAITFISFVSGRTPCRPRAK